MVRNKCKLIFADWDEISTDVIAEIKKAVKHHGLKFYQLDTGGDWTALALCARDAKKKDAEQALEQRKRRR